MRNFQAYLGALLRRQPAQPEWLKTLTHYLLLTSGPFQRYLCFPRRTPESRVPVPLSPSTSSPFTPSQFSHKLFSVDKNGVHRMHPNQFRAKPWYKPAGAQWIDRLKTMVGWYDCVPGPEWASSGYRLEEIVSDPSSALLAFPYSPHLCILRVQLRRHRVSFCLPNTTDESVLMYDL